MYSVFAVMENNKSNVVYLPQVKLFKDFYFLPPFILKYFHFLTTIYIIILSLPSIVFSFSSRIIIFILPQLISLYFNVVYEEMLTVISQLFYSYSLFCRYTAMCLSNPFLHKFKISSILCFLVLEYE